MPRHIRKTPLIEKLRAYPYDIYLYINETFASIDFDEYTQVGLVSSNLILIIFIAASKFNKPITNNSLFHVDPYQYSKLQQLLLKRSNTAFTKPSNTSLNSSILTNLSHVFMVLVQLISVVNLLVILRSKKTYSLLNSSKPKSPNARELLLSDDSSRIPAFIMRFLRFFNRDFDESFYNESTEVSQAEMDPNKLVYNMDVWQPSEFNLVVLSFLNPISLLGINIMLDLSIWKIFVIVLLFNSQLYFLIGKFLVLLSDKQILYQEMFAEYNNKFVKPKTNVLKQDVGIDATSKYYELDLIDHLNPYVQNTKSKVFIVHDINGKPFNTISKEDVDEERRQFESERIKFELEKDKYEKMINSSMESDWLRGTIHSTPFKKRERSFLGDHSYDKFVNPNRPVSPIRNRPVSPIRSNRPVSPIRSDRSVRSPERSSIRSPIRSPVRSPLRTMTPSRERLSPERSPNRRNTDRTPTRWR